MDADILLGTDPDSDRVGIGIKNTKGEWVLMNGNQTAVLAFNYMIEARKAKGIAKPNDMVVKTIVTTNMIDDIAAANDVKCYNVLTGFKWIAELITEKEGKENYIIGGEESYGLNDRRQTARQGCDLCSSNIMRDGCLRKERRSQPLCKTD